MITERASVYVIGPQEGPQKIGVSWLPESRLGGLQRGCPDRLFVHHATEYERDMAYRIENIVKRKLGPPCRGAEWFDVSIPQAILATIIAARFYFDVEARQIEQGRIVERDRLRLGLTKRELAKRLYMPEGHFSTDYNAALIGKPPPRDAGILDRVTALLAESPYPVAPAAKRSGRRMGLTARASLGDIAVSTVLPRRVDGKRRWSGPTVTVSAGEVGA